MSWKYLYLADLKKMHMNDKLAENLVLLGEREMGDQTLFRPRPKTLNMNELLQRHKTFDATKIKLNSKCILRGYIK